MRDPRTVVVRQIVTEKTSEAEALGKYTFQVARNANKHEIRYAIEKLFKVNVRTVRTSQQRGKFRRRGFHVGKQPNWKKAVVQLADGETIEIE